MFEEVKKTFMSYLDAFNTKEAANVSGYFHIPAVLMTSDLAAFMNKNEEVEGVFSELFEYLKSENFEESKLDSMQIKVLGENQAIVVGVATRYRKDKSILQHFGFTYTLRKTQEKFKINDVEHNWKIITGVIHDALDFSAIQSFKVS